jgi:menaquinone-dependent protoporphyrinogen oxidase
MIGPRVLVAYGSRHGSTAEIAEAVAVALRARGVATDVAPASQVPDVGPYDHVILGAAVYLLRWHPDVLDFLHAHERALASRPVWLFESGPLDDLPETRVRTLPGPVAGLAMRIAIRGHETFGGCLRPDAGGVLEQLMAVGGLVGDYREWDRIRAWADGIADEIAAGHRAVPVSSRALPAASVEGPRRS